MSKHAEPYLSPKEISAALERLHGLRISPDYIRAIRQDCVRRGLPGFVARFARASVILKYLKDNPDFRRRMVRKKRRKD